MTLTWTFLGRASYRPVWELQESIRSRIQAGDDGAERLLFVEHAPVVTLGRSADPGNLVASEATLARLGIERVRTNRGGDVTYHGPGQLVIYPVLRLRRGVVDHVESVGRALAGVLADLGIAAGFRRSPLGVWVGPAKIAACGVHVSRRVAIHGYALNVTDEVRTGFDCIIPCGLAGVPITTIASQGVRPAPTMHDLAERIAARVCLMWNRTPLYSCDPV